MRISESNPELEAWWSDKNDTPFSGVEKSIGTRSKYWWLFDCGHESFRKPAEVVGGKGCVYCFGRSILPGFNDLKTIHPEVAAMLVTEGVDASTLAPAANIKLEWQCSKGHRRTSTVFDVVRSQNAATKGCGVCANKVLLRGYNDVASQFPELAKMYSPTNALPVEDVCVASPEKVLWVCQEGHETVSSPQQMTKRIDLCHSCERRTLFPGREPASITMAHLAHEWRDERSMDDFSAGSEYDAKWECPEGHIYTMSLYKRSSGRNCSVCAGKVVASGHNDLLSRYPEVASEYMKSNPIAVNAISFGSSRKVMWKCSLGHEWSAAVKRRTLQGDGCPTCSNRVLLVGFNDLATVKPEIAAEWNEDKNGRKASEVVYSSVVRAWWICSKNPSHEWNALLNNRANGSGCPSCATHSSVDEREITEYLISLLGEDAVQTNVYRQLSNRKRELDIFIPSLSLAIEVNGVYWHSESAGKGRKYHAEKLRLCNEAGITLIQVWQDQWRYSRPVVESMLRHAVGMSHEKVYARNTRVVTVTHDEAVVFLDQYHIQGGAKGSYYIGLKHDDTLVAVAVVARSGRTLTLHRYATSVNVVGGHGKIVKWVERNVPDWDKMVTFADLEVSSGELYEKTGWVNDGLLEPDYKYLVGDRRYHKFNYRIKRFREDPKLLWEEGLSESQLAALNGISRVWDSGKIRYVYLNHNGTPSGISS